MARPDPEAVRVAAGRHGSSTAAASASAASRTGRRGRPPSARPPARARRGRARGAPGSRAGSRFGSRHFRARRSCAIAPHGPSCSTRWQFVSTSCRCSAGRSRSTAFFGRPVTSRSCGPVSGPSPAIGRDDGLLVVVQLDGLGGGDEQRQQPRRDAGRDPRDVLADADEPLRRQLVLRAPEEAHLVGPAHERAVRLADRPVLAGEPLTCSQSDGRTTSAFGKSSARPTSSTHAAAASSVSDQTRLQACRP